MSTTFFENAATKSVDVNGTPFVFREIGEKGGIPVVFLHHLTAYWTIGIQGSSMVWRRNTTLLSSTIAESADPEVLPPRQSRTWLRMPSRS
jgi:hypothetical protein